MRRLIINADDFGLTLGVNRGIMRTRDSGVVTSTTLMANGAAFDDAAQLALACGRRSGFGVGCHLVLVDGEPLLPAAQVRSLVESHNGVGRAEFRRSLASFAGQAVRGRLDAAEIESEACAQLQKIRAAGIEISHLDAHKHAHLFPSVFKPLLRAARNCGVRSVRNPFAPVKPLAFAHLLRRPHLWKRYSEVRVLRSFARSFRELAEAAGMLTTDGTFGIVATGALDAELFEAIIGCIPEGTWELCCHPGYNDAELARVRTRLRESRECEMNVLTSAAARETLGRHGIELISYWDLR